MNLVIEVLASVAVVAAVLVFMWRLPRRGESLFGWGPPLALMSAWAGLAGLIVSALLPMLPGPDRWLVPLFLLLDPGAIGAGTLVLWIYRGHEGAAETITMQRTQAKVGIVLGLMAVGVGYLFVMLHKPPGTPVGI